MYHIESLHATGRQMKRGERLDEQTFEMSGLFDPCDDEEEFTVHEQLRAAREVQPR